MANNILGNVSLYLSIKREMMNTIQLKFLALCLFLAVMACDKMEDPVDESITLEVMADLPAVLDEASGLIIGPNGNLVSHNDKGAYLYEFDFSGNLVRTIEVSNADNEDWEDISMDENGDIYVSDTGNNNNDRDDLKIYKISKEDFSSSTTVTAEEIPFAYDNQTEFPPIPTERHFDCEALAMVNNVACIFTRDRTEPFQGITKFYQTIDETAYFQGSLVTDTKRSFGAITAAALNADGTELALVSNRACWIISNFSGLNFFSGTIKKMDFNLDQQIEGAAYLDDCHLLLVDEKEGTSGGKLYRANICN